MEHGAWSMEHGAWSMERITWSMEHGLKQKGTQERVAQPESPLTAKSLYFISPVIVVPRKEPASPYHLLSAD